MVRPANGSESSRTSSAGAASLPKRCVTHRLDGLLRTFDAVNVRNNDALRSHVQQTKDETGIGVRHSHHRGDAHEVCSHDHLLNQRQIERGMLHVDERCVEPG